MTWLCRRPLTSGISKELAYDLLPTGQLGSVKAERRRLIIKHHLDAFLAGDT